MKKRRLYVEPYNPAPQRTLSMPRTWKERVLDLRHATGLCVAELSRLSGIPFGSIGGMERSRGVYHPRVETILALRRVEAIFHEELVAYLHKPHGLLRLRQRSGYWLQPYGGYRAVRSNFRKSESQRTVTFEGRTLEDIAQMDDLEAIRALKRVTFFPTARYLRQYDPPRRGAYGRIIEAASRGDFMPLAAIAHLVEGDRPEQSGQPATSR